MMSSYYKRASTHLVHTYITHGERIIVCTWPPHPVMNDIFTPRTLNIPRHKRTIQVTLMKYTVLGDVQLLQQSIPTPNMYIYNTLLATDSV
jgi:hypothetical protein